MAALSKTDLTGQILWLGRVTDRDADLKSSHSAEIFASFAGVADESHAGLTRASCSRVIAQYPIGTVIRNTRQFSVVSSEELETIAASMGIESLNPSWIGASIVISGLPDFTHLPPSSRLQFEGGATLVVDMLNRPCHLPAPIIDRHLPGEGQKFKAAAKGLRGVTAWVEREGVLRVGDNVALHIPEQRAWAGSVGAI